MSLPVDPAGGPAADPPVDPLDAAQVGPVLLATFTLMGAGGLVDLLARLPGAVHRPGQQGRMFRAATPEAVWLGPEDLLVLATPPVHEHVVGGVVLQRSPLPPAQLGPSVARLVVSLVRDQGASADASTVLTAARDVLARL